MFFGLGEPINEFDKMLLASNLIGANSLKELEQKEREITNQKTIELNLKAIKGNFHYQHLKDIHKYLFEDIYVFAGFDRADIGLQGSFLKGGQHFVPGSELKKYSKMIFDDLKNQNYLKDSKDLNHFAKDLTEFMSNLNALHPFREGNGRVQRIFINDLAKNAGYKLDLNLTTKEKMIAASIDASNLKNAKLEALIKTNLKSFKENLELDSYLGIR